MAAGAEVIERGKVPRQCYSGGLSRRGPSMGREESGMLNLTNGSQLMRRKSRNAKGWGGGVHWSILGL